MAQVTKYLEAMTKFESSVKQIAYPVADVYRNISDLSNLERVRDRVPEDKLNSFAFDRDTVSLNVDPVGDIKLRIIEREEGKCVKFETEQSPMPFMDSGVASNGDDE